MKLFIVLFILLTGCAAHKNVRSYKIKCHDADVQIDYNITDDKLTRSH